MAEVSAAPSLWGKMAEGHCRYFGYLPRFLAPTRTYERLSRLLFSHCLSLKFVGEASTSSGQATSAVSCRGTDSRPSNIKPTKSTTGLNNKRLINDSDENDEYSPGIKRTALNSSTDQDRRLACPYFKKDPGKWAAKRVCAGPGWQSSHRVKYCTSSPPLMPAADIHREHLFRRHALPIQCPRCATSFENDNELRGHLMQEERCEARPDNTSYTEGFNEDQRKRLRTRTKTSGTSEEAKWRDMYLILFPDEDEKNIPSPCESSTASFGNLR